LLANGLGRPAIWFTVLGNGVAALVNKLAEATNRLATLAIWFMKFAI